MGLKISPGKQIDFFQRNSFRRILLPSVCPTIHRTASQNFQCQNFRLSINSREGLGGKPVALGDGGIKISVFPRVPIILVLWFEDAEFPPDLQILFDASITEFLSTEDIAVLSQEVMSRMIKSYYLSLSR